MTHCIHCGAFEWLCICPPDRCECCGRATDSAVVYTNGDGEKGMAAVCAYCQQYEQHPFH